MIERSHWLNCIQTALQRSRIVALIGPRQVGKTTLARRFLAPDSLNYFDLEDPVSLARLAEPMTALEPLLGLVVVDEVQRAPELFRVLRVLADREDLPARFLLLGSASPALLRQASESLAGRIEVIKITGLDLTEVGADATETLWQRGGFPLAFLAASDEDSRTGASSSFKLSSNATCRSWFSVFQPRPWDASGPCWRITKDRFGMRQNRRARSACPRQRYGATWTC